VPREHAASYTVNFWPFGPIQSIASSVLEKWMPVGRRVRFPRGPFCSVESTLPETLFETPTLHLMATPLGGAIEGYAYGIERR
jgi:hypothetical protein